MFCNLTILNDHTLRSIYLLLNDVKDQNSAQEIPLMINLDRLIKAIGFGPSNHERTAQIRLSSLADAADVVVFKDGFSSKVFSPAGFGLSSLTRTRTSDSNSLQKIYYGIKTEWSPIRVGVKQVASSARSYPNQKTPNQLLLLRRDKIRWTQAISTIIPHHWKNKNKNKNQIKYDTSTVHRLTTKNPS